MKRIWVFLLGTLLLADQVVLKNGDRVTGKIVKKDGGNLVVATELMGTVTIPWASVTDVKSEQELNVALPGGKTAKGKLAVTENRIEVAGQSAPLAEVSAIRNEAEQKAYERLLHPGLKDLWAGYFDIGLSAARGNAKTNTFTTAFNTGRVTRTDKTTVYFNQIYSTASVAGVSSNVAQAIRGGAGYNKNFTRRAFVNVFNDYEYDKFQNLDLRVVLGGGAGYAAIKNDKAQLDVLGGVAYNREKFDNRLRPGSPDNYLIRNSAEAYWGDEFTYKLSTVTALRQSFRMFNNLTNTGAYRINFDLGLVTTIRKSIAWQITISDRYLSNPLLGRRNNDILYTTGLRFNFAK